jgi:hypothetical protein
LIVGEINMSILHYVTSPAWRHPAVTMLVFGTLGFVLGFLLSLVVAAQSLYVCSEIM